MLGGIWAWLTVVILPTCLPLLDWILGGDDSVHPDRDVVGYRFLPWLYIGLQVATTIWAGIVISKPGVTLAEAAGLTASVGLTAGVFGFLSAHEMVHSDRRSERGVGLMLLASVLYMHFRIAHIQGHHRRAATAADPATARLGESAYRFLARSVAGQVCEAWSFEATRLTSKGLKVFGPANRTLQYFTIEASILVCVALLSGRTFAFFLAQAVLAVILLELFNYVAHYGLARRRLPGGRYERLDARHSWNSTRRMNNWTLFNMGRHSDHHRFTTRHYQCLEPLPHSPELPSGYASAILMALVPPLWKRVMDPRVRIWRDAPV
ncbi:MAG TPA: alkane 1-monooxygenase [Caulobacteraceae bacterium]